MKDAIGLFGTLGDRLRDFGNEPRSQRVIAEAAAANGWFAPHEIQRAVAALREQMLQPERLQAWLAPYPVPVEKPRRVLLILAGNIPLVGFFDLLCVVVSGNWGVVKPAAKDSVLVDYLIDLLHEIDPDVPLMRDDGDQKIDALIATGSDNANRYFRAHYPGIPTLLRGSRHSVAVLAGDESPEQLAALADDLWAYSGLGCRNVSLVLLPEGCELRLPCPAEMHPKRRNNYLQTKALMTLQGVPFRDLGCALAIEQREFPEALSQLACTHYATLAEVEVWLAEHDSELQCVVSECLQHPRRTDFGRAQAPALSDYPDARDVIDFLVSLNG